MDRQPTQNEETQPMNKPKHKPVHQTKQAKGKTKVTKVRIELPGGQRLRFTESLLAYITNRPATGRQGGFRLGDWLATLDGDTLAHLVELSGQAATGHELPPPAGEDVLSVAVHATLEERDAHELKLSEKQLQDMLLALSVASTLESFRRQGLVEHEGRVGIENNDFSFILTEKGREFAERSGIGGIGAWSH